MRILTCPTAEIAATAAAQMLRSRIAAQPDLTLGLATGATMLPLYAALTAGGGPDMSRIVTFNLDEYVGLGPDHPGSYHQYMRSALVPLIAPPQVMHLPHGGAPDPAAEAERYGALIASVGGIDLQLLGLGRNGHIGFNEPGSDPASTTRVVTLTQATRDANARFFDQPEDVPTQAISIGIATILKARSCVLLATGAHKADAVRRMVEGPVGPDCPASLLAEHPDVTVILDSAAAARLSTPPPVLPPSELRNPATLDIDRLSTAEMLALINAEDQTVAGAVATQLPQIAEAVDAIVAVFQSGGRLIYVGAGTSGRLGVLDASECGPTFSVPDGMVIGLIAGGDHALRHPVEGAEDDTAQGAADLMTLDLTAQDVVVGLAASGTTPYVMGALNAAQQKGATTVAVTCNPGSPVAQSAAISIAPLVGPEVLTGSTRMKSGTAQKLVLNMLSTAAMIRIGKSWGNLMVDVSVSNVKLAGRARRILSEITGLDDATAEQRLTEAGGALKTAITMELAGVDRATAEARLQAAQGHLRAAIAGGL